MSLTTLAVLLGFLVGFLVGVVARDAYDLLRPHRRRSEGLTMKRFRWLGRNTLVLVVVVFAATQLVLGVLLIQQRAQSNDYTRCKAAWDQQFLASYQARVDVARDVSESMDRLIQATHKGDRDEFAAALDHYLKVRSDQLAAQKANPLPSPPQKVCGGVNQ